MLNAKIIVSALSLSTLFACGGAEQADETSDEIMMYRPTTLFRTYDLQPEIYLQNASGQLVGGCSTGSLMVTIVVRNNGISTAPASSTYFQGYSDQWGHIPTPSIPAGGAVALPRISWNSGEWPNNTRFVTVDAANAIGEIDESNNFAWTCLR